jgi:hypothetical protein
METLKMADEAVNLETGTGEPLSLDDAAGLMFSEEESADSANLDTEAQEAPVSDEDAPEPVDADDDQEDPIENTEEPSEPTYEVKVNGETKTVTLSELQSGYSRDSDYRQKTAELAEQKRVWAEEQQAIQNERQEQARKLDALLPQLQTTLIGKWAKVDWATLARDNPAEYVALKEEYNQDEAKFNAGLQQRHQIEQQNQAQQQAKTRELIERETEALQAALPEFKDPEKAAVKKAEIRSYLKDVGYDDKTISTLTDHRMIVIIDAAMRHTRAQKAAAEAKAKGSKAPPVSQPGARRNSSGKADAIASAKNRLARSGSIDDAAALLQEFI